MARGPVNSHGPMTTEAMKSSDKMQTSLRWIGTTTRGPIMTRAATDRLIRPRTKGTSLKAFNGCAARSPEQLKGVKKRGTRNVGLSKL